MIFRSILDTDLYKFSTSYAYIKLFPYAVGKFTFVDRDKTKYPLDFVDKLKEEIRLMSRVRLTDEELEYMHRNCRFIPLVYWEWLSSFRFDPDKITIYLDEEQHLHVEAVDSLYKVTLYEVPLLALISELKNKLLGRTYDADAVVQRLKDKLKISNEEGIAFSEFGTRRRFSFDVQDLVISHLKEEARHYLGTSNCYFGMKYKSKIMGTYPHEWVMFHGAQFGYKHANYMSLENWVNVYDGDLGTALSDTYTSESFLSNFSRKQAKLFDGVRCDSGDELGFVDCLIKRYETLGINPLSKSIIFSNALDFPKAKRIKNYCNGKIQCAFGIGTNLTHDTGHQAPNIVMKLSHCKMNSHQEWRECVKLSDDMGKHMGSITEVQACLHELRITE